MLQFRRVWQQAVSWIWIVITLLRILSFPTRFMPGWGMNCRKISVLNSSEQIFEQLKPLIQEAYEFSFSYNS